MLTMELTTWDGRSCRLPTLLSWCLTYTGGVPCDSMTACCPYDETMAAVLPWGRGLPFSTRICIAQPPKENVTDTSPLPRASDQPVRSSILPSRV